jgi:hypothetical protein
MSGRSDPATALAQKSISDDEIFLELLDAYVAAVCDHPTDFGLRIRLRKAIFSYLDTKPRGISQAAANHIGQVIPMRISTADRPVPPEEFRTRLVHAALGGSHTIGERTVVLERDINKPGNALAQLSTRLDLAASLELVDAASFRWLSDEAKKAGFLCVFDAIVFAQEAKAAAAAVRPAPAVVPAASAPAKLDGGI